MREALVLARQWRDAGHPTPIAVNVAGPNLLDLAFEASVHGAVHRRHATARDARGDLVPLVDHVTDERIGDGRSHVGSLRSPRGPPSGQENRVIRVCTLAT